MNLQPGQLLRINGHPDHLPLIRAIAEVAYSVGARSVETAYVETACVDPHVRRSRIAHAPEDTLDWSPPWGLTLIDEVAVTNGAMISITGDPEPELLSDLDPARMAKARPQARAELLDERRFDRCHRRSRACASLNILPGA